MRSLASYAFGLFLAISLAASAQSPVPLSPSQAPPVAPSLEPTPTPNETPLAPAYTIQAGTQLVIVDVSVKDKHGQKVRGLKASDFQVKESGKPQQIRNFDEHTPSSAPVSESLISAPTHPILQPGEFTNLQVVPPTGALNIILIDQVNTALKDQAFMHDQLISYLKHARPDARTAIFALNTRLVMLQGFTSDPAALLAAINQKGKLKDSVLRDDTSGGPTTSASSSGLGQILSSAGFGTSIAAFEAPVQQYQQQVRALDTLDALNNLARFLSGLPDRKNLIWFAGDFPPNFFPSDTIFDGQFTGNLNFENEYRDTVNLLSRARVAVYPIDAQGLRTDQSNNASKANGGFATGGRTVARNGNAEQVAHQADFANRAAEDMAMTQIAHDTGGEAFYNNNDLTRGVNSAVDDGASFYTISYTPDAPLNKDSTRSISVHVEAPGGPFKLSYRRAYYTDKKQHISAGTEAGSSVDASSGQRPASSLTQSLRAGAPPTAEILLRTRAYPISTPDQPQVLDGNRANPDKKLDHGPYRVYQVDGAASVLKFSFNHGADNIFHTAVDFVTYVYDAQGNLINGQSNTVNVAYPRAKLAELGRTGLHFNQQVSVPAKGDYFLRVAVRDNTSGNVGALEIPVSSIQNLNPPAASAADAPKPAQP